MIVSGFAGHGDRGNGGVLVGGHFDGCCKATRRMNVDMIGSKNGESKMSRKIGGKRGFIRGEV